MTSASVKEVLAQGNSPKAKWAAKTVARGNGGLKRAESETLFVKFASPAWTVRHAEDLRWLFFVAFAAAFVYDASYNALGTTNGKFISLVDTINSVASFRAGLPRRQEDATVARFVWIFLVSFVLKFAAQSAVSGVLDAKPVLLKGPRHVASFLVGFGMVWFSPGDEVYRNLRKSLAIQLLVAMCCGLYKLRKALFAVDAAHHSLPLAFIVTLLSLDGNSIVRKLALWIEHVWSPLSHKSLSRPALLSSLRAGLHDLVFKFVLPNLFVTGLLWGFAEHDTVELRIGVLVYFASKQGAFETLARIHKAGLEAPSPPVSPTEAKGKAE